jgi:hypothetical protein
MGIPVSGITGSDGVVVDVESADALVLDDAALEVDPAPVAGVVVTAAAVVAVELPPLLPQATSTSAVIASMEVLLVCFTGLPGGATRS